MGGPSPEFARSQWALPGPPAVPRVPHVVWFDSLPEFRDSDFSRFSSLDPFCGKPMCFGPCLAKPLSQDRRLLLFSDPCGPRLSYCKVILCRKPTVKEPLPSGLWWERGDSNHLFLTIPVGRRSPFIKGQIPVFQLGFDFRLQLGVQSQTHVNQPFQVGLFR